MNESGSLRYLAYMLRLWQVDEENRSVWRASLESPHTGERHGFLDLEMMVAFLQEKISFQPELDEREGEIV
jgi:hypothetical protein